MTHEPIELFQPWYPGGAQGADFPFVDGGRYLFAFEMAGGYWEIYQVSCAVGEEGQAVFSDLDDEFFSSWDWKSVTWVAKVNDFHFPPIGN